MEVEKKHMEKYFSMGVVMNGPQIQFVRTGLANYGPSLFKSLSKFRTGPPSAGKRSSRSHLIPARSSNCTAPTPGPAFP